MKKTNTKRALGMSLISLLACGIMFAGSTYAWFTDEVKVSGNKIETGTLKVDLEVLEGTSWKSLRDSTDPVFGGVLWEPGYTDFAVFKVENEGNLAVKWNLKAVKVGTDSKNLAKVIDVYAKESDTALANPTSLKEDGYKKVGTLAEVLEKGTLLEGTFDSETKGTSKYLGIMLHMQEEAGNEYQGANDVEFDIKLNAYQLTQEEDAFGNPNYDADAYFDVWNGVAASLDWGPESAPAATEYSIGSAADLVAFAQLVDAGETFEGKTITLDSNIDLDGKLFDPIGSYRYDQIFKGTFDGNGHTIKNLSQNTWELNNGYYYGDLGLGLFGYIEDATIKNLTVDGASISGESALCGAVAATAYGNCVFENITVKNSQVNDYQYYAGGVVGWASGEHTYTNINVDSSVVVGGQWGDFGNASGGIIGGIGTSGKYHFEDCTVACRIDAVNDVVSAYQWYCYRNCGMLIGKVSNDTTNGARDVVVPDGVTCKNVTVIYDEWADYHYCEFAGTGYPYVRVEAGVSVDGYSNVRYGHPTDANGNTVVDDNHVHNDGEDHDLVLVFDQLFGGPGNDRYANYGVAEYDGVTVIYNNDKQ